jgi:ATP-dependent 26S proteasome regulatory subunit
MQRLIGALLAAFAAAPARAGPMLDSEGVIDRPDMRGREQIHRVHVRGVTLDPTIDLAAIAARER